MEIKKSLLSLLLLLITSLAFAQTAFTGKVTHIFKNDQEKESGTIEIFYGDQKVRGIKKLALPKKDDDNDDIMIDFSKGVIYHINPFQKTYSVDTMKARPASTFPLLVAEPSKNTTVLNHHCSAFIVNDNDKTGFMDNMNFLFWYADSLYFPVNEKNLLSDEISLFTNGKTIGMGIAITMQEAGNKKIFGLTPVAIEPMALPDSLFEVPKDYVLETTEQYLRADTATMMEADSAARIMDSVVKAMDSTIRAIDPPKKPVKKSVPKSTKNKAPVKAEAIRRKE